MVAQVLFFFLAMLEPAAEAVVAEVKATPGYGMQAMPDAGTVIGQCDGVIQTWHALGPLAIGKTELDGDGLAGGSAHLQALFESWQTSKSKNENVVLSELLGNGGPVAWTSVRSDPRGAVQVSWRGHPNIDWQGLASVIGDHAVLETQTWLLGKLAVQREGRFMFSCRGLVAVSVGNASFAADLYHTGHIFGVTWLESGAHVVVVRLRMVLSASFSCSFSAVPALQLFAVSPPSWLPDLVDGLPFSKYLSVPIQNLHHELFISSLELSVSSKNDNGLRVKSARTAQSVLNGPSEPVAFLAPGQHAYLPTELEFGDVDKPAGCKPISFDLQVTGHFSRFTSSLSDPPSETHALEIKLRCRRFLKDSFLFSFLDHDGSVQRAGAVAPQSVCNVSEGEQVAMEGAAEPGCPILLSLHGTGVKAQDMSDAYKRLIKKKPETFKFGVRDAWTLTPSRHGAHNWEGVGMYSPRSALQALAALSREFQLRVLSSYGKSYQRLADPNRVLIAGHSMGGHGAWVQATHFPDGLLGVVPAAAWLRKETYSSANRLMMYDTGAVWTDPALTALLEASVAENYVDLFASNLVGVPVHIRIGAADRTVHPYESRRMLRILREANVQAGWNASTANKLVQLSELKDKEHWWWDSASENDGGVVNDKTLRNFFAKATKRSDRTAGEEVSLPPVLSLHVLNPASAGPRAGLRVLAQRIPFRLSVIRVDRREASSSSSSPYSSSPPSSSSSSAWCISTKNVLRFRLERAGPGFRALQQAWVQDGRPALVINGHGLGQELSESIMNGGGELKGDYSQEQQGNLDFCADAADTYVAEWALCTAGNGAKKAESGGKQGRTLQALGPARQVYSRPFLFVVGSKAAPHHCEVLRQAAQYLANLHSMTTDAWTQVVADVVYLSLLNASSSSSPSNAPSTAETPVPFRAAHYNVILLGGPAANHATARLLEAEPGLAFQFASQDSLQGSWGAIRMHGTGHIEGDKNGGCEFRGAGQGYLTLAPLRALTQHGDNLALIFDGSDEDGFRALLDFVATPTIPPMARAPFTNLVGDFLISGPELRHKGAGGLLAFGFLDHMWQYKSESSYLSTSCIERVQHQR